MIENNLEKLGRFRQRIAQQPTMTRIGFVIGGLFLLMVIGLAVPTLQATIGVAATVVVCWAALLTVIYIVYAVVRSAVSGRAK